MRLKPLRDTSFVALILLVAGIGDLQAARLDPAPISDEVVERVLRDLKAGRAHPLPHALSRHLDEASELIKQIEQEDQNAEKHTLLAAHIQQLDTLRSAIRAQFSETRATLVSLGATDKVQAWDDLLLKVEQRFDRIARALKAVT